MVEKIKVLLAEWQHIVREGLRALLTAEDDIDVVGEARDGEEAIKLSQKLAPDIVVMEIAMPIVDGIQATKEITQSAPSAKVLILTMCADKDYARQTVEAGARGYLVKNASFVDVLTAIREIHRGKKCFSLCVIKPQKDNEGCVILSDKPFSYIDICLTEREQEVLQLIAKGKPSKCIAAELHISIKTVEKHRNNLMAKTDIHDVAGLTRYATGKGIIDISHPHPHFQFR